MTKLRRRAGWMIAAVLVAVAAGVGYRAWQRGNVITASVPPRVTPSGMPVEFAQRVAGADRRARQGPDRLQALQELAQLYHANGHYNEALAAYRGLQRLETGDARWPYRTANILANYGQLEDAIPFWKEAIARDPSYAPAYVHLGAALLKLNRPAEAASVFDDLLRREPDNAYARTGLARVAIAANDWSEAKAQLEAAARASNGAIGTDLLVMVYERSGLAAQATQIRGRSKAAGTYTDPIDPFIEETYADCYGAYQLTVIAGAVANRGETGRAAEFLERALRISPEDGTIHYQAGLLYWQMRDFARAEKHFVRTTELSPDFSDAWLKLAELRQQHNDLLGSNAVLLQGLARCPNSPALHLEYGRRLASANRAGEALKHFRESIRLRPEEAAPYIDIALMFFRQDRIDEGEKELVAALRAEPGHPMAISTLALLAITRGNREQAQRWYNEVRIQPRIMAEQRADLAQRFRQKFGAEP